MSSASSRQAPLSAAVIPNGFQPQKADIVVNEQGERTAYINNDGTVLADDYFPGPEAAQNDQNREAAAEAMNDF